jgi:enediyne biosynthesis protein E4
MSKGHGRKLVRAVAAACLPLVLSSQPANVAASDLDRSAADSDASHSRHQRPITFTDIAKSPRSGISYHRTPSKHDALWSKLRSQAVVPIFDFPAFAPIRSRGVPGVAVFDYDHDGDLDIYVPNGPGSPNSLYANQLAQGKGLTFVDVAAAAGVTATDRDSTGVCYGDIDNDGDDDLYVLSQAAANKLFINKGDGTFVDVAGRSDAVGKSTYSTACSMGDVNGDGLLDIVIANTSETWNTAFSPTVHNQLLRNEGGHRFKDISAESGITQLAGFPPEQAGAAGLTWAIAMVDYDLDGDIDILTGDDLSAHPVGGNNGTPGYVHIMRNDGTGHYKDMTVEAGLNILGAWMGFSFGDINADGHLDMFVTNIGDYMNAEYFPYQLGERSSRWFLGQADSTFVKEEITNTNANVFGWGTVMFDYDNDGDTDIAYHGSMDGGPLIDASNPGIILENDGTPNMTVNKAALKASGHDRRNVQGVARGDLNNDGFVDLVSVSNFDIPASVPLVRYSHQWGSPMDDTAFFVPTFTPVGPLQFTWAGYQFDDGTLSIDINNGGNGNGAVSVDLVGTVGLLPGSRSNRDGVGATVSFTPKGGKTAMSPVVAGDSYASQNSLSSHFGLGKARRGTVEVLWPGGTRNRLYDVKEGERIRFPEIPCSYSDSVNQGRRQHFREYNRCVATSLHKLVERGMLDWHMEKRLYTSAIIAFLDEGRQSHR